MQAHQVLDVNLDDLPLERFFRCHLVANAVDDCYGCSAMELIGQSAGSTAPTLGGRS